MSKQEEINSLLIFNNDLSILRIEEFLEWLEDGDYLNDNGKELKTTLWQKYICEK